MKRQGLVWLMFALFYLIGFGVLGSAVWDAWQATRPGGWPTAPAKITHAELLDGVCRNEGDRPYRVEVAYTYAVDGVEHTGSRVAYGYFGGTSREPQAVLFERIRDAKSIAVRYDPANPAESCLSYGIHSSVGLPLWGAGGWLLFTAVAHLLTWVGCRRDAVLVDNILVEFPEARDA